MYRCESCGELSQPGEAQNRAVVQTREHVHPPRAGTGRRKKDDLGGTGTQIVRELRVCGVCTVRGASCP